jgi:hypothetical protein
LLSQVVFFQRFLEKKHPDAVFLYKYVVKITNYKTFFLYEKEQLFKAKYQN